MSVVQCLYLEQNTMTKFLVEDGSSFLTFVWMNKFLKCHKSQVVLLFWNEITLIVLA